MMRHRHIDGVLRSALASHTRSQHHPFHTLWNPAIRASISRSHCATSKGCRRLHSTTGPRQQSNPKQARAFPPLLILGLLLGGAVYYAATPPSRSKTLNGETFIPYAITAREAISPTSVVLTIAPHSPDPSPPYLEPGTARWKHPLWSVEFKQPEVQIARHYTPLPPLRGDADDEARRGTLRFYVRAVGGGEMSNYLSRLGVGRDVWLRGPHAGFDVLSRLGACRHVVFLAGGTGLVPGMQVASAVLDENEDATVSLLWAVRKREEVQSISAPKAPWWQVWAAKGPTELRADIEKPSHIAAHLKEMKAKYGDRLNVRVAVDEEGSKFRDSDVQKALVAPPRTGSSASAGCQLHDQRLHEHASEFETPGAACRCSGSRNGKTGKNLLMVSGPDGFIEHYAGPKVWLGGTLTQGPVGGVAAELQRRHRPLADDWLVLKL